MFDKLEYDLLITPEEAVSYSRYIGIKDIYIVRDIEYLCNSINTITDALFQKYSTLAIIWNAGRMQGIREERAKRKR